MFKMKIEFKSEFCSSAEERTLLAGKPTFDSIPAYVEINNKTYKVIGRSMGIALPFISLEIEKSDDNLVGYYVKESTRVSEKKSVN